MKEHFEKYKIIYLIIFIVICVILSITFIYFGRKYKNTSYTKTEAIGIMKLKADTLTRMIEINSDPETCKEYDSIVLSEKEMENYGFDELFYKKVSYSIKCKDNKQIISISITGAGNFKDFELKNYISNNN